MDSTTIFSKTAKGLREASGASRALPRALRAILKEIDGKKTFLALQEKLHEMSETELRQTLERLETEGYLRDTAQMSQTDAHSSSSPPAKQEESDGLDDLDFTALTAKPASPPSSSPSKSMTEEETLRGAAARQAAEAKKRQEADEKAKREAEQKSKLLALAKAKKEAEEKAKQEAEDKAARAALEKARREAEDRARKEAEKVRKEAEAKIRQEVEARLRKEAEERAKREAEEGVRKEIEAKARSEAEEKLRREAEEKVRREVEEKRRLEAEAKARQEAEEKARRKAEEKARREAEAKARREEEERVRKEAEEKARQAAEEQARREAEEKLKREIEEQVRKEAEEQARKEAEERARREAEEKLRFEAEAKARQDAEDRAKREAEEKARREAEERARREAEEKARREAEESARREAEEKARRDAEEKERLAAWELSKRKAEEKLKQEAEAKARQETEDRIRIEAKERAEREAEARLKEAIKEQARREAEEKARQEKEARIRKEAEDELRREAREKAKQEAREQAEREAAEKAARDAERAATRPQVKWGKLMALASVPLLAIVLGLIHLVPFDGRIPNLEKTASEQFQQPVKIDGLHLALFPQPHWRLDGVTLGGQGEIKAPRVTAVIDLTEFGAYKSLEFESPVLKQAAAGWLLFGRPLGRAVRFAHIRARNAAFESPVIDLPRFDAKADIGTDGNWQKLVFESANKDAYVELHPGANNLQFEIDATGILPLLGGAQRLDDFIAKGTFDRKEMRIKEFEGRNFGGSFRGNASLKWTEGWSIDGVVDAKQLDTRKLAPTLLRGGLLDGKAAYTMQAKDARSLFAAPHVEGRFVVSQGELLGVDLMHLLQNAADSGKTGFREISGTFERDGDVTQLRQLRMNAGIISASGSAEINAKDVLRGRFATSYRFDNLQKSGTLSLSGTLQAPKFSR